MVDERSEVLRFRPHAPTTLARKVAIALGAAGQARRGAKGSAYPGSCMDAAWRWLAVARQVRLGQRVSLYNGPTVGREVFAKDCSK